MRVKSLIGGAVVAAACGCVSVAPLDNPIHVRAPAGGENPIVVAPGAPTAESYAEVYERVIDVLDDYFELKPTSRYAGHIETLPRIAPGYEQPWKVGSPDARERLLATFQTIRHYAVVDIWSADRGGYRIYLEVYKEQEDLPNPVRTLVGGAAFRDMTTVDRRSEVLGSVSSASKVWVPMGRDYAFEQRLLKRIHDASPCK